MRYSRPMRQRHKLILQSPHLLTSSVRWFQSGKMYSLRCVVSRNKTFGNLKWRVRRSHRHSLSTPPRKPHWLPVRVVAKTAIICHTPVQYTPPRLSFHLGSPFHRLRPFVALLIWYRNCFIGWHHLPQVSVGRNARDHLVGTRYRGECQIPERHFLPIHGGKFLAHRLSIRHIYVVYYTTVSCEH